LQKRKITSNFYGALRFYQPDISASKSVFDVIFLVDQMVVNEIVVDNTIVNEIVVDNTIVDAIVVYETVVVEMVDDEMLNTKW
jgi:hypothetical protein